MNFSQGQIWIVLLLISQLSISNTCCGERQLSKGQELVIAAYELDVDKVQALLKDGASPDSRLGFYDEALFQDKWTFGKSPWGSEKWTPLLAVVNAYRVPQPTERMENSIKGLELARTRMEKIAPEVIKDRYQRRLAIVDVLVEHGANIDLDDGHGTTPLAASIGYEEIAVRLIEAGAAIDTKSGVYIDGPSGFTPVHRAASHPKVLKAMLKHNPKIEEKDSLGRTPLHWAVLDLNIECVWLLLSAGADPNSKDLNGRDPAYWCMLYGSHPDDKIKKEIVKLLSSAAAKAPVVPER